MPGPSGAPGAGNNGGPEKPDAGGLVEGGTEAWEQSGIGDIGIPGAPNGTAAGGVGLGVPPRVGVTSEPPWNAEAALDEAGNTVAAPPGVPGSAASPGEASTPDQPGAAELIGADVASWQPPGLDGASPLAPDGTPAGGVGLTPATEVAPPADQGIPQAPVPATVAGPGRIPTADTARSAGPTRPVPVDSVVTPPMEAPEPSADPMETSPQASPEMAAPYLPATPSQGENGPPKAPKPVVPPTAVDLPQGFPGTNVSGVEAPATDVPAGPVPQSDTALVVDVPDMLDDHGEVTDTSPEPDAEPNGGRAATDDEAIISAATVGEEATSVSTSEATPDSGPALPVMVMGAAVGAGAVAAASRRAGRSASVQPDDLGSSPTARDQAGHTVHSGRRPEKSDEQGPLDRPEAAELLYDEDGSWGEDTPGGKVPPGDDYVPLIRPDGDDDISGWDDLDDSAWLTEAYTNDQDERSTDA
ncbi:hypothetical protein [Salinispora arenicola]|uniref:hypothetical protein n=1 Tax=Salinispora arenicola TaxID=168697 RepID=UPI0012BC7694|nr:hypothetical protein [Salinispora arenicola]